MKKLPDHLGVWRRLEKSRFTITPPDQIPPDGIMDCTLSSLGLIRNARVRFNIEVQGEPHNFHVALIFRRHNRKYLGVGLGGWNSFCSIFNLTLQGFVRIPYGKESDIQQGKVYHCEVEFKGGFLRKFTINGQSIFPFENLSFRDSIGSTLRTGYLGLYANGGNSRATVALSVKRLPTQCFVITNIDGRLGRHTDARRRLFENVLKKAKISIIFIDSRDLTRERPLMTSIRSAILDSDIVIADTGTLKPPRGNVFYETGIAHTTGIPTVHIGPKANRFKKIVPSDLAKQFFILEHEIPNKLPETFKAILEARSGVFDYLS